MKTFVISSLVLAILFYSFFCYSFYLDDFSEEMTSSLSQIHHCAELKKWKQCKVEINKLTDIWSKYGPVLAMFNDHEEVDEIKGAISELKIGVMYKNGEQIVKMSVLIKILVERIKCNQTFTLENIL